MRLQTTITPDVAASHGVDLNDDFFKLLQRCFKDRVQVFKTSVTHSADGVCGYAEDYNIEDNTAEVTWFSDFTPPQVEPKLAVAVIGKIEDRKMNLVKVVYCSLLFP